MQVVTGAEMRQLEREAFTSLGISPVVVMENAGSRIVEVLKQEFAPLEGKRIHILVGPGNNGGDGLVVARQLLTLGARVKVYLVGDEDKASPENKANLSILRKLGADFISARGAKPNKLKFSLNLADLIIDAIFGTGFSRELPGELQAVTSVVNEVQCPVVAVDCPTGVNAGTGEVSPGAVKADLTINLGLFKLGCLLYPGREYAGQIRVVDLGFPQPQEGLDRELLGPEVLSWLPTRPPWGHKGTFGHTLVVAGSLNYAGAARLCGQAVLRGGGGVVSVAVPEGIYPRFLPDELIVVPVPQTEGGTIGPESVERMLELASGKDVLAVGPGLGSCGEVVPAVQALLRSWEGPVVIDADGLRALTPEFLQSRPVQQRGRWIITPHPGEMAQLITSDPGQVNRDRVGTALEFAKKWGLVVVLKGAPTIVAGPEKVYLNSTGSAALATAGTGDILTGLTAALLSQGMEPLPAAAAAVYIHGRAGDLAAERCGARGLRASDCLDLIQEILQ